MDCSEEAGGQAQDHLTEYELKRLQRIRENNAVLAALDLPALAASLSEPPAAIKQRNHAAKRAPVGVTPRRSARLRTNNGERKVIRDLSSSSGDESDSTEQEPDLAPAGQKADDEYEPNDEDEEGDEDEAGAEEEDKSASDSELAAAQNQSGLRRSGSKKSRQSGGRRNGKSGTARQLWTADRNSEAPRLPKGTKRQPGVKKRMLKGESPNQLGSPNQLFGQDAMLVDTDDLELQKALAMSMGVPFPEGEGGLVPNGSEETAFRETAVQTPSQGAKPKRQLKKGRRVELALTEDEIVKCFFLMDERVSGNVTFRDLQRIAAAHDFTWTDEELLDMINLFNANNDGKLNLEEFRDIALRCNRR